MRRILPLALASAAALSAVPAFASGAPMFDRPPVISLADDAKLGPDGIYRFTDFIGPQEFTIPASEDTCGVEEQIVQNGTFILKTFPDGHQREFAPRPAENVVTSTNPANGRSVTVPIGGPTTFTPLAQNDGKLTRYRSAYYGATLFGIDHPVSGYARGLYTFPRGSLIAEWTVTGYGTDQREDTLVSLKIDAPYRDICNDLR